MGWCFFARDKNQFPFDHLPLVDTTAGVSMLFSLLKVICRIVW
jgi:hypothetical protein